MEVTFITPTGERELYQGIERFHRMDPKDTELPKNHTQPWALVEFGKRLRIVGWDREVDSVSSESWEAKH